MLADEEKTKGFVSINIFGYLGRHRIKQWITFDTSSNQFITKTAREKTGRHFVLADEERTGGFPSINLFGHLGQHLIKQGITFDTLSSQLVMKTAREKIGRHFVLADKEKTRVFASINIFDHLWLFWATSYAARDHI